MIETSMVLYDDKYMVSVTKGTPGTVEFDFEGVWRFRKTITDFDPKKLTWLHVHPPGFGVEASFQDSICAKSLEIAFKHLGNFGIFQFHTPSISDCRGQIGWHVLEGSMLKMIRTESIEENPYLKGPAMVLKLHSFTSN